MRDPGIRFAHATFEIKSRPASGLIEGVISTPTPDHLGDILESAGARFSLPMPLLWDHKVPIGTVIDATVKASGIWIKAQLAHVSTPGRLRDDVEYARDAIAAGVARGLSVGWKPLEAVRNKSGGLHVKAWKWLESSVVIVPMNQDATITLIKSLDVRSDPFDRGPSPQPSAVRGPSGISAMNPISEQIETVQAELRTKAERLEALESAESDGTLSEEERPELDTLAKGLESLTSKVARLQSLERAQMIQAKNIMETIPQERRSFQPRIVQARPRVEVVNLPKGTIFTRYAMSIAAGKGSYSDTLAYARRWEHQTPELISYIKAIAGTTVPGSPQWGAELAEPQTAESEFVELLRARSALGQVSGFADAPFNTRMIVQSGGSTVNWVGEAAVKPVSDLDFTDATVPHDKAAGIVVLSNELIRLSTPKAEGIVRDDLVKQIAQFLDEQFFDPTITVTAARPASITNGVSSPAASGTTADDLRADFNTALATFDDTGFETLHIAMPPALARGISLLTGTLGTPEFSTMSPQGGSLMGFKVIVSGNVPDGTIVFFKANEIWMADDGRTTLDASTQATLDMAGGASPVFNLWQRNCTGIKAEREITWLKRRSSGVVAVIDTAAYAPS